MQDQQPPQTPPPAPPVPPAPTDQPTDQSPASEAIGDPTTPPPPPAPEPPAAVQTPDSPEAPAEGDAPITPAVPQDGDAGLHDALPSIPDLAEIPEAVKAVCVADGIPEAEFARDFPLPVEARERLILATIKRLTGVRPPMGDPSIAKAAEGCENVGKLIDLMIAGHPDHPVAAEQPII